jgi:HK97 gp10 family phage protein
MAKKVTFSITGWQEMIKDLNEVGIKLDDKDPDVKNAIYAPASAMIENARNLAPIGKTSTKEHKAGTLRRSLLAAKGPKGQRGIFLVARKKIAPYASYVEFGTSKMSARPFFRPAFLQMASTYAGDLAPAIKTIIEAKARENAYHPPQ